MLKNNEKIILTLSKKEEYNINSIMDIKHMRKEEKYRKLDNQKIAYYEDREVFYIVDMNNYEKKKYLGYDTENNSLRYISLLYKKSQYDILKKNLNEK